MNSIRRSIQSVALAICASSSPAGAQTPGAAANFNDSVGVFRETTTSDWPAVFISPFTYASQPSPPQGLTISTTISSGILKGIFSLDAATTSRFRWELNPTGPTMEFLEDGSLVINSPDGTLEFSAGEGKLSLNGSPVLTNQLLLAPQHFNRISAGSGSTSTGLNAFASGNNATAPGLNASGFGLGTTAQGYNQFVIGQYNTLQGTGTANTNAQDSLFIIGNGSSTSARSNALSVSRSGDMKVSGRLTTGFSAAASGDHAAAVGYFATATGSYSMALGPSTIASGNGATAMSAGNAAGAGSLAIGNETNAYGDNSFAEGGGYATGHYSLALGSYSEASGLSAIALGKQLIAQGINQFVVGQFNKASGTPHNDLNEWEAWEPNEEAFIIGNGQNSSNRSNAFTVERNGNVNAAGRIRVWPAGDLSMGAFKTGTKPTVGVNPDGP